MNLIAKGLDKSFSEVSALSDVSLAVQSGSIHALIGENGAGKSTLLKIMAGIYRPDGGEVLLDGQRVYENPEVKARIAFVPTQCTLFPGYHEKDLLDFYAGVYPRFRIERYRAIIGEMELNAKPVRKFSTGMQMLTSVAIALAAMPDVLLLDEPFAGLDVIVRHRLITLLIEESEARGVAMLISSHNVNELEKLCDQATFITRGRIVQSGEMHCVKHNSVRKLQVVFKGDPPEALSRWDGVLSVETIGKVHHLTVRGAAADIDERLAKVGVLMIEELPITLEEAFRLSYEQGGKAQ